MTGYGRACKTLHGREITVELRSVNNRFLDCSVRLPRAFSYAEDAIKQLVKDAVQRGKVDGRTHCILPKKTRLNGCLSILPRR